VKETTKLEQSINSLRKEAQQQIQSVSERVEKVNECMNEKLESQLLENKECQDELARDLEAKTKEIVSIELSSFI
jgi:hypothetical protein